MKANALAGFVVLALAGSAMCEPPGLSTLPKPQEEHEWLQQPVGNWDTETGVYFEEGKPPVKAIGSDSAPAIGGFWVAVEFNCKIMGSPMSGLTTCGYDLAKKRYVGTAIDSMSIHLATLEGTLDATGPDSNNGE